MPQQALRPSDMQLPFSFKERMSSQLGEGFPAFLAALESPAPVSIRLNPAKKIIPKENWEKVDWHPEGFYLPERPMFTLDPSFHAGAYYVQEASSMFLFEALRQTVDLSQKTRALDLCASPGGKSTLIASAIGEDSLLLSNEVVQGRIPPLKMNIGKWGHPNVAVSNHDPADFKGLEGFFDVVLVDAPCSGEGLFRKDPAAIGEWSEANVQLCEARQRRILGEAVGLVKEGGMLFYSTCTFNDEENKSNVKWLIETGLFELARLEIPTGWGIRDTGWGYQFFPHLVKGEGFFMACLRKISGGARPLKPTGFKEWQVLPANKVGPLRDFFTDVDAVSFYQKPQGEIVAIPSQLLEDVLALDSVLKKRSFGLVAGAFKGRDFIPSHAFALSNLISKEIPAIELDEGQALHFLKKDNIHQDGWPKGWICVRFRGLNLGWIKVLQNRTNNYLPSEWRIRMSLV